MTELFNDWKPLTIFAKIAISMFNGILNLSLKYFAGMPEACKFTKNQLIYSHFVLGFVQILIIG